MRSCYKYGYVQYICTQNMASMYHTIHMYVPIYNKQVAMILDFKKVIDVCRGGVYLLTFKFKFNGCNIFMGSVVAVFKHFY